MLIGAVMLVVAGVFASAPWTGHGSVGDTSSVTRLPAFRSLARVPAGRRPAR